MSPQSCVDTSMGSRPTRAASPWSRSAWKRSIACSASTAAASKSALAHAERCRDEIERLEGAETRGAEAQAALAAGEARREKLGKQLSKGRAAAAAPLRERVAEGPSGWQCRAPASRSSWRRTPKGSERTVASRSSC